MSEVQEVNRNRHADEALEFLQKPGSLS